MHVSNPISEAFFNNIDDELNRWLYHGRASSEVTGPSLSLIASRIDLGHSCVLLTWEIILSSLPKPSFAQLALAHSNSALQICHSNISRTEFQIAQRLSGILRFWRKNKCDRWSEGESEKWSNVTRRRVRICGTCTSTQKCARSRQNFTKKRWWDGRCQNSTYYHHWRSVA